MSYKFRMSIGDWSDDGHGKHEDFIIQSNAPIEIVREAHWKAPFVTGVNIEELCSEYEETHVEDDVVEKLRELGFEFDSEWGAYPTPYEMARLWVFLLEKADPYLELEIVTDDIPSFHFYGVDEKNRHIGQVGYGLFD